MFKLKWTEREESVYSHIKLKTRTMCLIYSEFAVLVTWGAEAKQKPKHFHKLITNDYKTDIKQTLVKSWIDTEQIRQEVKL